MPPGPRVSRDRDYYVDLGVNAIWELLEEEHAVVMPEIEAKISEEAYGSSPVPVDPHHLTTARKQLVLVETLTALGGAAWIDKTGPRPVFAAGAAVYVLAYAGFALPVHAPLVLLVFFCLAGAGIGFAETAESTLVAQVLPDHLRGSGFGLLGGLQSAGDFLSSASVGIVYAAVGPGAGFGLAAAAMVLSLVAAALTGRSR